MTERLRKLFPETEKIKTRSKLSDFVGKKITLYGVFLKVKKKTRKNKIILLTGLRKDCNYVAGHLHVQLDNTFDISNFTNQDRVLITGIIAPYKKEKILKDGTKIIYTNYGFKKIIKMEKVNKKWK